MEEREGAAAVKKAKNLIQQTSHLFAGITSSFHPAGLPNEVAGKSSNTQWGLSEAYRFYASEVSARDSSHVFVTVGDADTLWHPQFFSALAYQGLSIPAEERVWTVWQPPVLLTRNLWSVPGPIRASGLGTILFELSGLANQRFGTHITFSTYSMTVALLLHPDVNGWDTDVIAEDHHMFCKCYFASLWDQVNAQRENGIGEKVVPKVQLQPVFLPTVSYMAESSAGYMDSLKERFVQAKRHSYGVVELGYVLLQYVQLIMSVGAFNLPLKTHAKIISLGWKMFTVHITNTVQCFSLLVSAAIMIPTVIDWLLSGGVLALLDGGVQSLVNSGAGSDSFLRWVMCAAFGPFAPVSFITACVMFVVVMDLLEGRYALPAPPTGEEGEEDDDAKSSLSCAPEQRTLSIWRKLRLAAKMQSDVALLAEPTIFVYGMFPELIAAWTLLRQSNFEYVVGAKPVGDKDKEA
jgi:hypothetical protein